MPYFINLRSHPVGGWLDTSVPVKVQLSPPATPSGFNQPSVTLGELQMALRGQHVLVGTHGFNVNFVDGVTALSFWSTLLHLPAPSIFVGLLWPGDSVWAHGLDYPEEPKVADETAAKLAPFIDVVMADAASVSFVSHSLGARVVLQTANRMSRLVRRVTLMAGAIDDDCLNTEFKAAARKVGEISVLASKKDAVLGLAFPLGNLFAGIIDQGHPWWRGALGRYGPTKPWPANFQPPFEIPDNWQYGHHSYLQDDPGYAGATVGPVNIPPNGSPCPILDAAGNPVPGWEEAWSSAFAATRFDSHSS
jgi:pimeloyl-ACP methyl ester carboxylesterase